MVSAMVTLRARKYRDRCLSQGTLDYQGFSRVHSAYVEGKKIYFYHQMQYWNIFVSSTWSKWFIFFQADKSQ